MRESMHGAHPRFGLVVLAMAAACAAHHSENPSGEGTGGNAASGGSGAYGGGGAGGRGASGAAGSGGSSGAAGRPTAGAGGGVDAGNAGKSGNAGGAGGMSAGGAPAGGRATGGAPVAGQAGGAGTESNAGRAGSGAGSGGATGLGGEGGGGDVTCTKASHGGHDYTLCPAAALDWPDAAAFCEDRDLKLVKLDDADEETWVYETVTAEGSIWIGANDRDTEGDWRWADGGAVSGGYTHWADGQPNDSGTGEDCAVLHSGMGEWNDVDCSFTAIGDVPMSFVCEQP